MLMTTDTKEAPAGTRTVVLKFRWKYILMPLIFFFISIALFIIFYWQLNPQVAYRFNTEGVSTSTASREMLALFMLLPHLFFVLLAGGITGAIVRIGGSLGQVSQAFNPERLLLFIGNVMVMPQIIFAFIMLDIFRYDINGSHLMPVWIFAVIVMIVGSVIMIPFFIQTFLRSRKADYI